MRHICDTTATQMRHSYDTRATRRRHNCDTTATQMQHKCDTTVTQVRHKCDITETQLWHNFDISCRTCVAMWGCKSTWSCSVFRVLNLYNTSSLLLYIYILSGTYVIATQSGMYKQYCLCNFSTICFIHLSVNSSLFSFILYIFIDIYLKKKIYDLSSKLNKSM